MLRSAKLREPVANRLLTALSSQEYQRLRPHLEEFTLSFGEILYEPGQIIRHVYFPNSGIVSLLSMVEHRSTLEVGVVGNEGMVGISIFLGAHDSFNRALVQGAGTAMRMTAQAFRKHIGHKGLLPDMLRRYTHSLLAQISQTAACNRFHSLEQRLSRWLLDSQDRLNVDTFPYTQQLLSTMLGADRVTVTLTAGAMKTAGLIHYTRGQITILNRGRLESASCECYKIVKTQFRQFL